MTTNHYYRDLTRTLEICEQTNAILDKVRFRHHLPPKVELVESSELVFVVNQMLDAEIILELVNNGWTSHTFERGQDTVHEFRRPAYTSTWGVWTIATLFKVIGMFGMSMTSTSFFIFTTLL